MKADLHVHTNFSEDGFSTPEEVVDAALSQGLNYIAITDHDTTDGALRARDYAQGKGIVVLVGQEISCKEGHVLAINIQKELPKGISTYEAVNRIHKQGGYAIAPHPFTSNGIGFRAFTNDFDAVEGLDGFNYNISSESKVKKFCKKWGMPMTASSSAHDAAEVGICGIEFDGDIFDCLVGGNFKTFGKKLPMNKALFFRIKYYIRSFSNPKLKKGVSYGKKKVEKRVERKSKEESF